MTWPGLGVSIIQRVNVGENAVIFGGMDFGDVTWVRGFQYTKVSG